MADPKTSIGEEEDKDQLLQYIIASRGKETTLTDLIEIDSAHVILLGEGNCTLSWALALRRGTWEGIVATTYEKKTEEEAKSLLQEGKDLCFECHQEFVSDWNTGVDSDISRGFQRRDGGLKLQCKVESLEEMPTFEPVTSHFRSNVDATNKKDLKDVCSGIEPPCIFWFHCPWSIDQDTIATSDLIKEYLEAAFKVQQERGGGIVLLGGVANDGDVYHRSEKYYQKYGLSCNLITKLGFELHGITTTTFYSDFIGYGYHHETYDKTKKIHGLMQYNHFVLVLRVPTRHEG